LCRKENYGRGYRVKSKANKQKKEGPRWKIQKQRIAHATSKKQAKEWKPAGEHELQKVKRKETEAN
jgi:hypothetical protein